MKMEMKREIHYSNTGTLLFILLTVLITITLSSCDKSESYSDLLRDEEKACNWYLSNNKVENEIPEDGKFITGKDAPFYKLDPDGYVYMQVINAGDDERPQTGDIVYFRFWRENIKNLYEGISGYPEGNAGDLGSALGSTYFIMDNLMIPTSSQWGKGIQMPMNYLGYNSEVNLVLRSYYGFSVDQSSCLPYIINLRYFKPIY